MTIETLEVLKQRRAQIFQSRVQMEQNFHTLTGHMNEVDYQIAELQKQLDAKVDEQLESPVPDAVV